MAKGAEATVTLSLIDRITGPLKRIGGRLSALGKKIGFERITTAVGRLGTAFKGLGDGLLSSAMRLASVATLIATSVSALTIGAYKLVQETADLGASLGEASTKLGVSVEALQEWRYTAKMSGIEAASFDKGVEKLGINAVSAAKGNKAMAKEFKALGVRLKDTKGKMRPMEAVLEDTLERLADMKDPIERNRLAFKLLGKSGVELTKMMADGSKGLRDMRNEARETGNVMSSADAALGDEFGDNVDRLKERLQGLKMFLGVQLLPLFNDIVQKTTAWVDANRELIKTTISDWAQRFGKLLQDLINPSSEIRKNISSIIEKVQALGPAFSQLMDKIQPVVEFLGGPMNTALAAIGLWALAPTIAAVTSLAFAFSGLALAIGKVSVSALMLGFSGLKSLFTGVAAEAATAGTVAGTKYGTNFSKSASKWIRAGLMGLGAIAAYEIIKDMPSTPEEWKKAGEEKEARDKSAKKWLADNLPFNLGWDKDGNGNAEKSPAKKLLDGAKRFIYGNPNEDYTSRRKYFEQETAPRNGNTPGLKSLMDTINRVNNPAAAATTDKSGANNDGRVSNMTVGNLTMPEPIVAHEPQVINAPFNVGGVTINAKSDSAADINAAVNSALSAQASKQAAAVKSSLSD